MKYLLIVFTLIATTLVISLMLFPSDEPVQDDKIAVTVNGHNISDFTLAAEGKNYGYHDSKSDLYESVITREILIQEAQRLEIDKEVNFRKSLKKFYENSLVKILLERKNKEITVSVSEKEIDTYLGFLGKTVSFTRLDTIPTDLAQSQAASGIKNTALFDDLAEPLRLLLSTLKPGGYGVRFDTGSEKYAIRLDSVDTSMQPHKPAKDREKIQEILMDYKREQMLNRWLTDLKAKAQIQIHHDKE